MADKSEILEEIEKRVGEAHSYLGLDQARDEMTQLESRAASPDLWDNQEEATHNCGEMGECIGLYTFTDSDGNQFVGLGEKKLYRYEIEFTKRPSQMDLTSIIEKM